MATTKSTRRVPQKPAHKPASKSIPKRASKSKQKPTPKPVTPAAQLRPVTLQLGKQQKQLHKLSRELSSAKRSLSSSRKPDTIKAATKRVNQAQRETAKQAKQVVRTTKSATKLIKQAFKWYSGKAQPRSIYKAAKKVSNTAPIVSVVKAPVKRKSVPKKTSAKTGKKATTKVSAKKAKSSAVKRVPKKAKSSVSVRSRKPSIKAPAKSTGKAKLSKQVIERSKRYREFVPVPKAILVRKGMGEDVDYPIAKNEQFSVRIFNRAMMDTFDNFDDAWEASEGYIAVPESGKQIGTIAFKETGNADFQRDQFLRMKAQEIRDVRRVRAAEEKKAAAEKRADKKRIKELEKKIQRMEKERNKKGDK